MHNKIILIICCLLLFLLIVSTSLTSVQAQVSYFTSCDNCLAIRLMNDHASSCSTLPTVNGVSAVTAIVRSLTFENFIFSVIPYPPQKSFYVYDGSDEANEGTWIVPSTGEILFTGGNGGTRYRYAWMRWSSGEPNNAGDEDLLCYLAQPTHSSSIDAWRSNDVRDSYMSASNSGRICMYQFDVISSFRVISALAQPDLLLMTNNEIVRFQVFAEHVTQLQAFEKCEKLFTIDPNTGLSVRGELAVFYTRYEFNVVVSMLQTKSDVRFHSTDSDYGIWVGANSSTTSIETWWYQRGTTTDEAIKILSSSNNFAAQAFFDSGESASQNSGVAIGLNSAENSKLWKLIWTPHTISSVTTTLPYVCQWRFNINVSLRLPNMLRRDLSGVVTNPFSSTAQSWIPSRTVANVSYFVARLHGTWEKAVDAEETCWNSRVTNEAGDTVRGTLAQIFKSTEWNAIRKLSQASQFLGSSNGITDSAAAGYLIGASQNTNWDGSVGDLKGGLRWNRAIGKISVDGAPGVDSTFGYTLRMWTNSGASCIAANTCESMNVDDTDNAVHMTYRDDTNVLYSFNSARRRGFICTYRFPVRFVVSAFLVVEYNSYPMIFTDAMKFCTSRTITSPSGDTVNGTLTVTVAEYYESGREKPIQEFLSNAGMVDIHGTGPVFLARTSPVSSNLCWTWRRLQQVYVELPCDEPLEFMCYFKIGSRTMTLPDVTPSNSTTISHSDNTQTHSARRTPSRSGESETSSPSLSQSDFSPSKSENSTMSESLSVTPSFDPSSSPSLESPSHSLSSDQSASSSITVTESPSRNTASESQPTQSSSNSSEQSPTATLRPTQSSSLSPSLSVSPSLSDVTPSNTFHIVSKYEFPNVIQDLKTVTSLATIFSGGGSVAVTQARLEAVDSLSRCGTSNELDDDEPDFMSAPMGWRFSDGAEHHTSWARGTAVGNVVAAALAALIMTVVAMVFGLVFKQNWRLGLDAARIPGLLMIPFFVLVPSSSEVAGILLFNDPTPVARLIAIGSSCVMMGVTLSIVIQLGRLVSSGLVVLRTLPPTPLSKIVMKLEESHWGRKIVRVALYMFTSEVGWVPHIEISEYLDVVSGKDDPTKTKQSELATTLAVKFGAVYEDYTLAYLPAMDVSVSIVLGVCSGVAQGPKISRTTCIVTLSTAVVAASIHFFVFIYYRPCLVRMTQIFMTTASGLTLASVSLSFAFYMGQSFSYTAATEKIQLVQALLGVLLMAFGVGFSILIVVDFVDAFLAGKDLRHLQKVTKEQIEQYREEEMKKTAQERERKKREADRNSFNSNKKSKMSSLEQEFSILVEEMKPVAGEEDLSILGDRADAKTSAVVSKLIKKNLGQTSQGHLEASGGEGRESDEQEMKEVMMMNMMKVQKQNEALEQARPRELSYHDYIRRGDASSSSSSEENIDENDPDTFFVPASVAGRKQSNNKNKRTAPSKHRQKNLSQRDRHLIAHDITETSAMIRSVIARRIEDSNKNINNNASLSSSNASNSTASNKIPQFRNAAVTTQQAQRMQQLLAEADERKKKQEEERILKILKEQEERELAQKHYEERRAMRVRTEGSTTSSYNGHEDHQEHDDDSDDLVEDAEEKADLMNEVDDILGRL